MIILIAALLATGLLLCLFGRWVGLVLGVMVTIVYLAWYGYPTVPLFLPDEFYLLATHERAIWVETDRGVRAFSLDPVPQNWRKALEQNDGQPVRMRRKEEEDDAPDLTAVERQFEVIDEYRMRKDQSNEPD